VAEYEADELADNSDDEKRLYRARKERNSKKRKAAVGSSARKRGREEGASRTADMQPRPPPPKTRPLGPCYTCGEYGHLARNCAKAQQPYPFDSCKSIDVCGDKGQQVSGQPATNNKAGPNVLVNFGTEGYQGLGPYNTRSEQVLNSQLTRC